MMRVRQEDTTSHECAMYLVYPGHIESTKEMDERKKEKMEHVMCFFIEAHSGEHARPCQTIIGWTATVANRRANEITQFQNKTNMPTKHLMTEICTQYMSDAVKRILD